MFLVQIQDLQCITFVHLAHFWFGLSTTSFKAYPLLKYIKCPELPGVRSYPHLPYTCVSFPSLRVLMRVSNSRVQCSHSKVQFSILECSDRECKVTSELHRTLTTNIALL